MIKLDRNELKKLIKDCLIEDIGNGDATTLAIIPKKYVLTAKFITREDCVCAGLEVAEAVFQELDETIKFTPQVKDGDFCPAQTILAEITAEAQTILTGERLALNFLQRLCGIATMAKKYADVVKGTKTQILDTRKTTPGLRILEKYAVAIGGATNHRIGLFDRIMIKDNHREIAKLDGENGIEEAVKKCREKYPDLEIEIEADSLKNVQSAINAKVEYILLDNMSNETMAEAVKLNSNKCKLEASGNITLERVKSIAELGIDFISVGALTHSVRSIDIGLDIIDNK